MMSEFPVKGHSEKFAFRWHEHSDKRYWERFLRCGQLAEPEIFLATEILSWEGLKVHEDKERVQPFPKWQKEEMRCQIRRKRYEISEK